MLTGESDAERAAYAYYKGKALSFTFATSNKAIEWLKRAVKLNPRNSDGWSTLGHCYWAKGELTEARGCFLQSIEQSENAEAFRHLSMICRQIQEKNSGMWLISVTNQQSISS